jgi:hypothetical protein
MDLSRELTSCRRCAAEYPPLPLILLSRISKSGRRVRLRDAAVQLVELTRTTLRCRTEERGLRLLRRVDVLPLVISGT